MAKGRPRADSQRQLRVGELVRHALVDVFAREELRDPGLAGVNVTVSEVRMSPDLRHAVCFVMPLGGGEQADVLKGLERSAPWLTGQVARRVKLKFAARLRFQLDRSFEEADRIERLLRRPDVARDLAGADARESEDGDGA
jgi:ribosome-binding factor A